MCHQAFNPPVLSIPILYTLPVLLYALYIEIRLVAFSHIAIHSVKADGGQHAENKRMFNALSHTAFFQDKGKYREQQRIK